MQRFDSAGGHKSSNSREDKYVIKETDSSKRDLEWTYFKGRLDDQIKWYDKKSAFNKKRFYFFKVTQISCTSLIPVLVGLLLKEHWLLYIISLLSLISVLCQSFLSLFKYQENWIQYRNTAESLQHEKYMYQTKTGTYDNDELDTFKTLVERAEALISSENVNWANMNLNYKGSENKNGKA
ncbi:DUF4231 domain-containing protein [Pediococcus acidilactici]|nr:DUF4231 domain-containing protein [Pediococcus acidilactici]NVM33725.1 DUF4231 domain-containing protein [Pediococcus acidilactici]